MNIITADQIGIIIPVFNRKPFTLECLRSIEEQTVGKTNVYIFDDGSTDGTKQELEKQFPWVRIIEGEGNYWWTASVNAAIQEAIKNGVKFILTMNNDLILDKSCIENLISAAQENPKAIIGCAGYDIHDKSKLLQWGTNINWITAERKKPPLKTGQKSVLADVLPGRGLLFPSDLFTMTGGFDQRRFPQSIADYDFVLRAKKFGYQPMCVLDAKLYIYSEETGLVKMVKKRSLIPYFTSRRSAANVNYRIKFALKHCPLPFLPIYILLDLLRITAHFWKK